MIEEVPPEKEDDKEGYDKISSSNQLNLALEADKKEERRLSKDLNKYG